MSYAALYFLAALAQLQVARAIFMLYAAGEHRLAIIGAVAWLCIIQIAE